MGKGDHWGNIKWNKWTKIFTYCWTTATEGIDFPGEFQTFGTTHFIVEGGGTQKRPLQITIVVHKGTDSIV